LITPIPCAAGSYASATNSASCTPCPAGSYCLLASTGPIPCGAGYICPALTTESPYHPVYSCPAGKYCLAGTATGTDCPVGTYRDIVGASLPTDCVTVPAGYYVDIPGTSNYLVN